VSDDEAERIEEEAADRSQGQSGDPGAPALRDGSGRNAEIARLVGRLTGDQDMDRATRGRLLGRLARLLGDGARRAGAGGLRGGRWLADLMAEIAPHIPVRDARTLSAHHHGLTGERLADSLVRVAANSTTAVGAAGGALSAVQFAAPPLLLTAPAQVAAETVVIAAIEVKLIAELHAVYGVQVPGAPSARAAAFLTAWARQRGVDPLRPGSVTGALGPAARAALRRRLLRTMGRSMTTLGPLLTGAAAGATLNRAATRRLAEAIRADLRRQAGAPQWYWALSG